MPPDSMMIRRLEQMDNDDDEFEPLEVAFSDNDDINADEADEW